MRFLDSSAIVKLVLDEFGSAGLKSYLENRQFAASELARTEVIRAVARRAPSHLELAFDIVEQAKLIQPTRALLDTAARLSSPSLRSLDAIHLASALELRDELTVFVAYDDRLLDAASALGMSVASPGA